MKAARKQPARHAAKAPAKRPTESAKQLAFAACRSVRFAVQNAERNGGDFSLNDILAANRLATDALRKAGLIGPLE